MHLEIHGWTLVALLAASLADGALAGCASAGAEPSARSSYPSVWCSIIDVALAGHVYNTTVTKTHKLCWVACRQRPRCLSTNFASRGNQGGQCDFNNATLLHSPSDVITLHGWLHTYRPNQPGSCSTRQPTHERISKESLRWPLGTYGLPMPAGGCPATGFTWATGYRHHDTENGGPTNAWSSLMHLQGTGGPDDMDQHFCMKTAGRVSESWPGWPQGEYCVFKYAGDCPIGMSSGSVFWDDEDSNNANTVNGTVPSGQYGNNTRIDYCCMVSGNASQPIALPTRSPFYLFPYTEQCQEVHGMMVSQEWFRWNGEDLGISTEPTGSHPKYEKANGPNNLKIYYCYYS